MRDGTPTTRVTTTPNTRVTEGELLKIETTAAQLLARYKIATHVDRAAPIEASFAMISERLASEIRRLRTMILGYMAGEDGTLEQLRDEAAACRADQKTP